MGDFKCNFNHIYSIWIEISDQIKNNYYCSQTKIDSKYKVWSHYKLQIFNEWAQKGVFSVNEKSLTT